MEHSLFVELSLIIAVGTVISIIIRLLRQPLIIGYILTGIIVGPSVFDLVSSEDTVDVFASIGITLLLFIVGLGLNPRVIREVGKVAAITGVGQVLFTSTIGYFIARSLGFENTPALFIAVALAFSSTIIILKLISDKKEQGRLYGKISVGFLLVQDIIATLALVIAGAIGENGGLQADEVGALVIKGVLLGIGLFVMAAYVLPHLTTFVAGSQEFLFLFAIGWGLGIASLFAEAGFSLEVGALFAGVSLASLPYAQEVGARLRPLRDFFVILFFIALGARLGIDNFADVLPQAALLSAFVLFGNPIIVMTIMGILGYTKKTSFKAGLAVAQISEFSLVLVLLGERTDQISSEVVTLVTVVALITIAISSYMIIYSDKIYERLEPVLRLFERRKTHPERERAGRYDMVLFGYRHGGPEFLRVFHNLSKRYIVVDYDPLVIDRLEHEKVPYLYGDATDVELLNEIALEQAKLIIATISDHQSNVFLVKHIHELNPNAVLICHSDSPKEAAELYEYGATYVMMPHYLGSEKISNFIKKNGFKKSEFKKFRERHLSYLQSHPE